MFDLSDPAAVGALLAFAGLLALYCLCSDGPPDRRSQYFAVLGSALFILLVLLRAPNLLRFQRVWAEIAVLYMSYAYEHGPWLAIIRPVSDYFDLTANLAAATSVLLGLRSWPIVDTAFGLLPPICLPFALSLLGYSRRECLALMLVVATALYSVHGAETFGTALHVKAWGAVYAFLVILSLTLCHPPSVFQRALLVLLPLTGPSATILLVMFGAGLIVLPFHRRYLVLAWAIPSVLIQIASAFGVDQGSGFAARPLSLMSVVFAPDLLLVQGIGSLWWTALPFSPRIPSAFELATSCAVIAAVLAASLVFCFKKPERAGFALLGSVVIAHFFASATLALNGAASLYNGAGFRYYFPLICMVGALCVSVPHISGRTVFRCGLAATVFFIVFHSRTALVRTAYMFESSTPKWSDQVKNHGENPDAPLFISPPGWTLRLPNCGEFYC